MSHPPTVQNDGPITNSADPVKVVVVDNGEGSVSMTKTVTRVVAASICASFDELNSGGVARATWKPDDGKCAQLFGLDTHNELGIESGSTMNSLKTATVKSARLLESHSTFPVPLGVNVSCLPKNEIVESGDRYVYCALPTGRINAPQTLFISDPEDDDGSSWRTLYKEYNIGNLDTHGTMESKGTSTIFVNVRHPVMNVLRNNIEVLGTHVDNIPLFDKEWKKISRTVFNKCVDALRDHLSDKVTTHDLTNFQVNIERVGGREWLDFEGTAALDAHVGGAMSDVDGDDGLVRRFMTTPYEFHARIELTYEIERHDTQAIMEGAVSNELRGSGNPQYIPNGDPGMSGGGTYTYGGRDPTIADYENIFGPAARDIKLDPERNRRRQRWHLPDALHGANPWLADRIDGLISKTDSPFTSYILPYKHLDQVDAKLKWNVWSFDEGMASRVPYESSARVMTQTKRSFSGYTVRQGLGIVMEANFMMTDHGMKNFRDQLNQVAHSIQYSNNYDVHVALLEAPSYQKHVDEKYWNQTKSTYQQIRDYVDMFGFVQKNPNALDFAIEEAKSILRSWGAKDPDFLLCNSKLTMQLTMTPERTQYFTQGPAGPARLAEGPEVNTYRGIKVIHSHSFSVETGSRPRDLLTRRVRVGEYYRAQCNAPGLNRQFQLYDESRDTWFTLNVNDLIRHSLTERRPKLAWSTPEYHKGAEVGADPAPLEELSGLYKMLYMSMSNLFDEAGIFDGGGDAHNMYQRQQIIEGLNRKVGRAYDLAAFNGASGLVNLAQGPYDALIMEITKVVEQLGTPHDIAKAFAFKYALVIFETYAVTKKEPGTTSVYEFSLLISHVIDDEDKVLEFVMIRPNIEHNMFGIILGKGGGEDLGYTLWGQTQLECASDSIHGLWGMQYKYNERAIVFNEKNLIRLWDIAYASYSGGKDSRILRWDDESSMGDFEYSTGNINQPYNGPSLIIMGFDRGLRTKSYEENWSSPVSMVYPSDPVPMHPDSGLVLQDVPAVLSNERVAEEYLHVFQRLADLHNATKPAGEASHENLTSAYGSLFFQGSMRVLDGAGRMLHEIHGSGHHGPDYVGVASRRNGKGMATSQLPGVGVYAAT